MKNRKLLLLALLTLCIGVKAQTSVPALITSNQVWDISGSPYIIGQNTFIDTGISVIVKPGVEIKATGLYKIDINGEFQAVGKWDSIITINKVELNFSQKSKDYNKSTGRGAYFNYCNIIGNGSGSKAITVTTTSLKVDHCIFSGSYMAVYLVSAYPYDTIVTDITNSKFSGDQFGYGSPISGNIIESKLTVTNCLFANAYSIYTYGNITFKNNTFYKLNKIDASYLFGKNEISCNRFLNMGDGIKINVGNYNSKGSVIYTNNTMDSFNSNSGSPMFTLARPSSSSPKFGKVEISNNNFLTNLGKGFKVTIASSNQSPTKTDTADFKSNYWGSGNPTIIADYIKDYNDDINIYGRVDFTGYKNAPITGCSYNTECAKANFIYTQKDSVLTFKDSSYGSKPHKVRWVFGDGNQNDSNRKTIVHSYDHPGVYMACLYVSDTNNNLCDSMCRIVIIKSKSKCQASWYFAVDTNDASYVYIVNTSKGINSKTKYYWTFGDGAGSSATNPSHTYSSSGKYQLCLTIFDTMAGCYSTFCDSVDIVLNGMKLLVVNEVDLVGIKTPGFLSSITLFPNPTAGNIKLSINTLRSNDLVVEIFNSEGRVVNSGLYTCVAGENEFGFDLSGFENGLYCINIRSGSYSKTMKLVLRK